MEQTTNTAVKLSCPQCGATIMVPAYAEGAVCAYCGSTLTREAVQGPGPEKETLHSVQCSQCAGPLDAFEGRRVLVCSHCGVRFAVKAHSGFSRWQYPSRVDRLHAAAAGAAWLGEYPGILKGARSAHLVDAHLFFAPIWEHKALVAGWEFGGGVRTRMEFVPDAADEDGGRLELGLVDEEVQEAHLQERRFYQEATDFVALGARRPRVSGRELLLPLLAGELDPSATVLEANGSADEIAQKGRAAALQPLSGAANPDAHIFTLRESVSLLYFPLWLVRFQYGDSLCRVVINGRDGSVNGGLAPADNRQRVAVLAAQTAVLVGLAAIFAWRAWSWPSGRVSMAALAVIVSLVAILLCWRFRKVGEVEYHEPFSS